MPRPFTLISACQHYNGPDDGRGCGFGTGFLRRKWQPMTFSLGKHMSRVRGLGLRLKRDQDGATAVEFAIVSVPFLMLLFGIMGVCQIYFWVFTAENAVWTASRGMRTGAFQTQASGSPYAGLTGTPLLTAFQQQICNGTVNSADCMANSVVQVRSNANFANIAPPNCIGTNNTLVTSANAMAAFDAGATSSVVIVTLCYAWAFGAKLPFLPMPQLSNGAYLIQTSAVFRTEPF